MAEIDQGTVDAAIDPYAPQIATRRKRQAGFEADLGRLSKEGAAASEDLAKTLEQRGEAGKPVRDQMSERLKSRPSAAVNEENIPSYQRPNGNDKEMERGMSALAVAAMLVGVASRQPFYGMAQAMSGFMKGYMDADQHAVEESMKVYDKNLEAIKQRNASKRRAVDAAMKDYENDLLGMQQQLKIIAAQFDDPVLAKKVREASISDQRNIVLEQLKVDGNAIDHLVNARESMLLRRATLAERIRARAPGHGVAPTGADRMTAQQILKSFPWYGSMDDAQTVSLSAEVAARAKSKVARNEVVDFSEGVDEAVDELQKEGALKVGKSKATFLGVKVPGTGTDTTFQRPAPGTTGPRGEADDLEEQARQAIADGKDSAAVAKRYKELTGKDLGGV